MNATVLGRHSQLCCCAFICGVGPSLVGHRFFDYMLRVMRDEKADDARRDAMAKAVAPYCHPHLASVATTNENGRHADNMTDEELIKSIEEQANSLGWKIDFGHSTTSRAVKRSGQGPSCQDRSLP